MMKKLVWMMPLLLCACVEEKVATEFGNPKEAAYSKSFEDRYGSIAADQDWGFNSLPTRSIVKEPHEWRNLVDEDKIPAKATAEEIEKVCNWFKENPNPAASERLNWSDFWIVPIFHSNYAGWMNQVVIGEEVNDINGGVDWRRLVVNGNTQKFSYMNSAVSNCVNDRYTIQKIDGSYYLGFQFYGEKWDNGTKIFGDNDGTYDDWIFKLVPAVYKGARRIIAEDLGSIGDFDFNDVVFDAAQVGGEYVVTLYAAGGTLPLKVGGKEVHELFGVPVGDMVNTGTNKYKNAAVVFRAPDIQIVVEAYTHNGAATAGSYVLKSECGKAPQMICVPTTYEWTLEGQSIEKKYPDFVNWVGNKEVDWLN